MRLDPLPCVNGENRYGPVRSAWDLQERELPLASRAGGSGLGTARKGRAMRILDFLKDSGGGTEASGLIHECGLAPTYHRVFSSEEQAKIEARQADFPFTRGEYIGSRLGEIDMITDLAIFSQRFCNDMEDRFIAVRLKSVGAHFLVEAGDWFALHQILQEIIREADHLRMELSAARAFTKACCELHIRHALQIRQSLPAGTQPGEHLGYWVMAHLLEEETNYDRALHYAEQGLQQGWQGNWEARIKHLRKLAPPRSTKTTIVSTAHGRPTPPPSLAAAQSASPPSAADRAVECGQCGQRMRIPASFTKAFGACARCGHRVDIPTT